MADPPSAPAPPASMRRVLLAGTVVGLAVTGDSLLYAVLPSRFAEFGVPAALVGMLLGVNRLVRLVFNALAGRLYTRAGRGLPFTLGAVLATLTTGGMALLPGFWPLLVIRIVWGGSWSLLRLGGYVAVLEDAGEQRGRALGLFWAAVRAGMLAATVGGAALVDWAGLRAALVLAAALAAVSVVLTLPGLRHARRAGDPTLAAQPPRPRPRRGPEAALSACIALHAFVTNGLVASTLGFALLQRLGPQVPVAGYAAGVATLTGALLGMQRLTELLAGPALGAAADRFGRLPVFLAGTAGALLAVLALMPAHGLMSIAAAVVAYWTGAAAAVAALDATAADLAHRADGARLLARYATWADLGSALGPPVGFALAAPLGLVPVYGAGAALLALSAGAYAAGYARRVRPPGTATGRGYSEARTEGGPGGG